jgi:phenylacetic acid degradation operon negative regulatory protein
MKPKTEEFLNFLLWSAVRLCQPTVRNLTDSYEAWIYRQGFWRQTATLEQQGFVERPSKTSKDRLYLLTELGRLQALGGRDPEIEWARKWDGRWRLVLFDVPRQQNTRREKLRRYLRSRAFGCLQGSVWITPDLLPDEERRILAAGIVNVKSLIVLSAAPCAGESHSEIVAGAWDFNKINRLYDKHLEILERRPSGSLRDSGAAKVMQRWAAAERQAWLDAVSADPLLPQELLPAEYLGRRTWHRRIEVLREAGGQVRSYTR